MTLTVEIANISEAQASAIRDMLTTWVMLGNIGSSRNVQFYVDGDGIWHPRIKINGEEVTCPDAEGWIDTHERSETGDRYYFFDEDQY